MRILVRAHAHHPAALRRRSVTRPWRAMCWLPDDVYAVADALPDLHVAAADQKGSSMSQRNIEIVLDDFVDAFRRRDLDAIARRLHPDVVWEGVVEGLVSRGRHEVLQFLRNAMEDSDGLGIEALELLDAGDHVILGMKGLRFQEPLIDTDLGGQLFNVLTLKDGQIVHLRDYVRREDALKAAGAHDAGWR
ncbi:MAG: hypothetical protein GEV03_05850 [Streptosporangiales bacterium]|nr:hypothetical protein [Streptosporangiales bacterium]